MPSVCARRVLSLCFTGRSSQEEEIAMDTSIEFRVTGRVQGVGFRAFVQRTGRQLGLTGWDKNNADGSVSGVAEGDRGLLVDFVKQVKIGNRWSSVDGWDERSQAYSGEFKSFEIRY